MAWKEQNTVPYSTVERLNENILNTKTNTSKWTASLTCELGWLLGIDDGCELGDSEGLELG